MPCRTSSRLRVPPVLPSANSRSCRSASRGPEQVEQRALPSVLLPSKPGRGPGVDRAQVDRPGGQPQQVADPACPGGARRFAGRLLLRSSPCRGMDMIVVRPHRLGQGGWVGSDAVTPLRRCGPRPRQVGRRPGRRLGRRPLDGCRRRRLVACRRTGRSGMAPTTRFLLDGDPTPLPDPRSPLAAARRARRRRGSTTTPGSPGPTPRWRGVDAARVGRLRAARRHLHRRGDAGRGGRAARPPGRPGRRPRRADAGGGVPGRGTAGGTTGCTRTRCTSPTAGRTRSSGSSTPATRAGSGSASTSSTTTSGRRATTCRGSGPTSPTSTRRRGARRSTSTTTGASRCGAGSIDNALMWLRDYHLDALRLDAVHALADDSPVHLLAELSREVDALSVRRTPAADPDRRVRPQPAAARCRPSRPAGWA